MCLRYLFIPFTDRKASRSSFPVSCTPLVLLLFFLTHTLAIDPGQLGLRINAGLANDGKYVYNSVVQFEDDIEVTWYSLPFESKS